MPAHSIRMKCLYEVLGIERDVDESAIKSAYRKAALRWHPDKNQANLQEAEDRFKEVQNAYEILSDKHERSWYDSHRDSILRSGQRHQAGGDGGGAGGGGWSPGQRPDDDVDLWPFFSSTAFSGFGSGPNSFYSVYSNLFQTLAKQELNAYNQQQSTPTTQDDNKKNNKQKQQQKQGPKFPEFGGPDAPWEDVSTFYRHWSDFMTTKDFSWADLHNTAAAPNRKYRRAMDAENSKARKLAKKEFNEQVRELAGFIRKRDKRVAARAVEEAKIRQEKEEVEREKREREKEEKLERLRQYEEAEWLHNSRTRSGRRRSGGDDDDDDDDDSGSNDEEEDESLLQEFYCVACEKYFKSEASLVNHERSKKHVQKVEVVRDMLLREEEDGMMMMMTIGEEESESDEEEDGEREEEEEGEESESESDASCSTTTTTTASSRSSSSEEEDEEEEEEEEVDEDEMLARLMGQATSRLAIHSSSSDDDEEEEEVVVIIEEGDKVIKVEGDDIPEADIVVEMDKKKKKRKEKKKNRQGGESTAATPTAAVEKDHHLCSVCRYEFPTRNQLFKHIKATGHAALK